MAPATPSSRRSPDARVARARPGVKSSPQATRSLESQKQKEYNKALGLLEQAKEAYILGFSEGHPKVAWSLEGLGKVHQKMGNLRMAEQSWNEAIAIRRNLQSRDTNKQMFSKELDAGTKTVEDIASKRTKVQQRFKAGGFKTMLSGGSTSSKLLAAVKASANSQVD